jgi:putative FmdB family regulatory protein
VPIYQYSCTECGHFLEAAQKFTDDALTVCPECDGRLRKVFNAVGVVFKGSGFYRTDSRKAPDPGSAGSSSKEPAAAGSSSSSGAPASASSSSASSSSSSSSSSAAD